MYVLTSSIETNVHNKRDNLQHLRNKVNNINIQPGNKVNNVNIQPGTFKLQRTYLISFKVVFVPKFRLDCSSVWKLLTGSVYNKCFKYSILFQIVTNVFYGLQYLR